MSTSQQPRLHDAPPTEEAASRPSQLSYVKTRVVQGRHYIDTSDESSSAVTDSADLAAATSSTPPPQVAFVASDLNERIRMSSPAVSGGGASGATTSSSPSPYPPLVPDAHAIIELEAHARHLAQQLNQVLREFTGSTRGIMELTVEYTTLYNKTVHETCDEMDQCIKSMYQLVAKAEELSEALKPLPRLAQHIKEVRRMLDMFESHMQKTIA